MHSYNNQAAATSTSTFCTHIHCVYDLNLIFVSGILGSYSPITFHSDLTHWLSSLCQVQTLFQVKPHFYLALHPASGKQGFLLHSNSTFRGDTFVWWEVWRPCYNVFHWWWTAEQDRKLQKEFWCRSSLLLLFLFLILEGQWGQEGLPKS